jgi:hypothetical protein
MSQALISTAEQPRHLSKWLRLTIYSYLTGN